MKKTLKIFLLFLTSISLVSCSWFDKDNSDLERFNVFFVIDGNISSQIEVNSKTIIQPPTIPEKTNFEVIGWTDEDGNLEFFQKPISSEATFYAKYLPDYPAITNLISKEIMSSNVKIEATKFDLRFLRRTNVAVSQGSGVIFHEQNGNYFVLTNEHVTTKGERSNVEFKIIDYKGTEYTATLLENSEQADYDLAVIFFTKKTENLHVIKRATVNPIITEEVVAIGQPEGQNNTITWGDILSYKRITLVSGFSPDFEVIEHSAESLPGSSGGALINLSLDLVGLNFAGTADPNTENRITTAIPIEIINYYLDTFVFTT